MGMPAAPGLLVCPLLALGPTAADLNWEAAPVAASSLLHLPTREKNILRTENKTCTFAQARPSAPTQADAKAEWNSRARDERSPDLRLRACL